jgi:ABC-type transport system involved in cytochrome bd biosynthesis fused ATPase/permease subunit
MTTIVAGAIILLAVYIGFKILKFVASMMIKALLFFVIVAAAAYVAIKYVL